MSNINLEYAILKEIDSEKIPMGASLLASRVDASQATIGRTLLELENCGFIQKIGNKGRVLTQEGQQNLEILHKRIRSEKEFREFLELFFENPDVGTYREFLETRILLEGETGARAATRISTEVKKLQEIMKRHQERLDQGDLAEEENIQFHYYLSEIAGNKILEQMVKMLLAHKGEYWISSHIHYRVIQLTNADHKMIFEAVKAHDADAARAAMHQHLAVQLEYMESMPEKTPIRF